MCLECGDGSGTKQKSSSVLVIAFTKVQSFKTLQYTTYKGTKLNLINNKIARSVLNYAKFCQKGRNAAEIVKFHDKLKGPHSTENCGPEYH